jgi:hypothetical protein
MQQVSEEQEENMLSKPINQAKTISVLKFFSRSHAPAPTIAFSEEDYRRPQDPRLKRFKAMAIGLARLRGRYEPPNVDVARKAAADLMFCRPILSEDVAVIEASFNEILCWVSIISRSRRELMLAEVLEAERQERAERDERDGGRA